MKLPEYDICGCAISGLPLCDAMNRLNDCWTTPRYICFANAHTVFLRAGDPEFRKASHASWITFASGMPLSLLGNFLYGHGTVPRVFGADFMAACLRRSEELDLTHYFYGSTPDTLQRLVAKYLPICGRRLLGWNSPPFGGFSDRQVARDLAAINRLHPKIIWIGLGAPAQELFMYHHFRELEYGCMVGAGAAFDFEAGTIHRAPAWAQKMCLQWVFRLASDPRRLWKRYLATIPAFCWIAVKWLHEA